MGNTSEIATINAWDSYKEESWKIKRIHVHREVT